MDRGSGASDQPDATASLVAVRPCTCRPAVPRRARGSRAGSRRRRFCRRGIWNEPPRTGKANETSAAHNLRSALTPIDGTSREGFVFGIDRQVQIHVPGFIAPGFTSSCVEMSVKLTQRKCQQCVARRSAFLPGFVWPVLIDSELQLTNVGL